MGTKIFMIIVKFLNEKQKVVEAETWESVCRVLLKIFKSVLLNIPNTGTL